MSSAVVMVAGDTKDRVILPLKADTNTGADSNCHLRSIMTYSSQDFSIDLNKRAALYKNRKNYLKHSSGQKYSL